MINFIRAIDEICAKDNRYKADSYEFAAMALHFTQKKLKRQGHISAKELSEGAREFAINQYGPMAKTVLNYWGLTKTQDLGNIIFNMIDAKLFSKTESDSIADFKDVYDFEAAFGNVWGNSERAKKACRTQIK